MTFLRKDPNGISNHFDELFRGIGHRGSSFMDIDSLTHDWPSHRFLMIEFKRRNEPLSEPQEWALTDFARKPGCLSFAIWLMGEDDYTVRFYPGKEEEEHLSRATVRKIYRDWWNQPNINVRNKQPASGILKVSQR